MAKPVITDKPIIDQAEFNGITIWRKEGGSIEVSDTNYPSMKAAISDIAQKAGVSIDPSWNTQYAGWYLIQQLKGKQPQSHTAAGPELVDLGLSVKWASCNLGASKPEEFGRYFAYGDVKGQTWDGKKWSDGGFEIAPVCEVDTNGILKKEYDAASVMLGNSYRMPTIDECKELLDSCELVWTTVADVKGMQFTSKKNNESIFLPASGFGVNNELRLDGYVEIGLSSISDHNTRWSLEILEIHKLIFFNTNNSYWHVGLTIRPVSE